MLPTAGSEGHEATLKEVRRLRPLRPKPGMANLLGSSMQVPWVETARSIAAPAPGHPIRQRQRALRMESGFRIFIR